MFILKDDSKVIRGKDGWLFLANDSNQVLSRHSGDRRFSEAEVRSWHRTLETRRAWLLARGAQYFFVIPPNTHSVYPEMLPPEVVTAPERPVHQVLNRLAEAGSQVRVLYPVDELAAAKEDDLPVFRRTDTHWTGYGAFLTYRALEREMIAAGIELAVTEREDVIFRAETTTGDLGYKVDPNETSAGVLVNVTHPSIRLVRDNCVANRGSLIETENDSAPDSTCVVLGDSYSYTLMPFFAHAFGRVVLAHTPTLDFGLVEQERPRVVVSVLNERFFASIPCDVNARSTREDAGDKRRAGALRPKTLNWPEGPARGADTVAA